MAAGEATVRVADTITHYVNYILLIFVQMLPRAISIAPRCPCMPHPRLYSAASLLLKNDDITRKFAMVMLVDDKGTRQPAPVSPATILSTVDRHRYDLVLVNAGHEPPLVRLRPRSAGYERERVQEAAASLQRLRTREKEVRFSLVMAPADRERRLDKARELLAGAYRVRLLVEGGGRDGTSNVQGREQLGRSLLAVFREAHGKDLSVICPPETGVGHWTVTIQSASAEPVLLRRRQEQRGASRDEQGEGR